MKVFEILLKVYLLEDIEFKDVQEKISRFIDKTLAQTEKMLELHNKNIYKNYCFNSFYPLEKDRLYKEGKIYTITIRTVDRNLAIYFNNKLADIHTYEIKGLKTNLRVMSSKKIKRLYSIMPVVMKNDDGYWRGVLTEEDYKRRLKENLIKKYNDIHNKDVDENFELYCNFKFDNKEPISRDYKGKKLLGDKITLEIADDEISQEIAYMALGTGIGEMNARGFGFLGYRWKR